MTFLRIFSIVLEWFVRHKRHRRWLLSYPGNHSCRRHRWDANYRRSRKDDEIGAVGRLQQLGAPVAQVACMKCEPHLSSRCRLLPIRTQADSSPCAIGDRCSLRCKARNSIALLHHFVNCIALLRKCAGWASLDTFAASCAILRMAPIVPEIADNARVDSARCNLPNIRSFELSHTL